MRGKKEEKNKKHAKLLGIYIQIDLQKILFTKLYKKRSEIWSQYNTFEIIF